MTCARPRFTTSTQKAKHASHDEEKWWRTVPERRRRNDQGRRRKGRRIREPRRYQGRKKVTAHSPEWQYQDRAPTTMAAMKMDERVRTVDDGEVVSEIEGVGEGFEIPLLIHNESLGA
ncbi:hypothetical protein PIB30_016484 [Stylosanthes scabra]|uniref:Uncharacterized protein n=1 Tax=Stylosanthes scabra TaxID=79078 RepID=A0ABU6Y998_9FABA|nr:hypothetical protein [Stylosanthes scabra]